MPPPLPFPEFAKVLTLGAAFTGVQPSDQALYTFAPAYTLRAGFTLREVRLDMEVVRTAWAGTLKDEPYDYDVVDTHLDARYGLFYHPRLNVNLAVGLGSRRFSADSLAVIDGQTFQQRTGIRTLPLAELFTMTGVGMRYLLVGPLHLRVEAHANLVIGSYDAQEAAHFHPGGDFSVGIDLRWEPPLDTDRDGVPDSTDKCRTEPEDLDYFEDTDGCIELDNDGDGVADEADACANQPEDVDGHLDADGCRDNNDDGDAYPDHLDACPRDGETENNWEDQDGCPDAVPPELQAVLGVRPLITFTPDDALTPEAEAELKLLVAQLQVHPKVLVQIRVSTIAVEGASQAREQSKRQAKAIFYALSAMGVPGNRLAFAYLGDTERAERNLLADDPSNRRVEVRLHQPLDGEGKPVEYTPLPPEEWP